MSIDRLRAHYGLYLQQSVIRGRLGGVRVSCRSGGCWPLVMLWITTGLSGPPPLPRTLQRFCLKPSRCRCSSRC